MDNGLFASDDVLSHIPSISEVVGYIVDNKASIIAASKNAGDGRVSPNAVKEAIDVISSSDIMEIDNKISLALLSVSFNELNGFVCQA